MRELIPTDDSQDINECLEPTTGMFDQMASFGYHGTNMKDASGAELYNEPPPMGKLKWIVRNVF